jgi:hypothetical protein
MRIILLFFSRDGLVKPFNLSPPLADHPNTCARIQIHTKASKVQLANKRQCADRDPEELGVVGVSPPNRK